MSGLRHSSHTNKSFSPGKPQISWLLSSSRFKSVSENWLIALASQKPG